MLRSDNLCKHDKKLVCKVIHAHNYLARRHDVDPIIISESPAGSTRDHLVAQDRQQEMRAEEREAARVAVETGLPVENCEQQRCHRYEEMASSRARSELANLCRVGQGQLEAIEWQARCCRLITAAAQSELGKEHTLVSDEDLSDNDFNESMQLD